MIDAYGDSFIALVKKMEEPMHVCNKVGLCSQEAARPKRSTSAVGSNPCTWGPSFWCTEKAKDLNCAVSNISFKYLFKYKSLKS